MITKKELELYIHIPFCMQKCNYCDFLSFSADTNKKEQYVQALLQQIEKQTVVANDYEVTTIFVGGGTPSILETEQMQRIFAKLREVFSIRQDAEITIEINPGTTTDEKIKAYKELGMNRLSIGLQSANDAELKVLGRIHTYQEFYKTFQQARAAGFANINIDLMSAIPGQSVASWKESLEKNVKLQPEHISVYSLIIEEGTPFYQWYEEGQNIHNKVDNKTDNKQILPLPDEDMLLQIDEVTNQLLAKHAYQKYEISNYAKAGYACKHNLGYWDRKEYLGIGLGAASYIAEKRMKNVTNMQRYLVNPQELEEEYTLSVQEQIEEFCFLGLRKMQGISEAEFKKQFGCDIKDIYGKEIEMLQGEDLLQREKEWLCLTKRGAELGNYVFEQFVKM